jgi:DNA replication protein DnaC
MRARGAEPPEFLELLLQDEIDRRDSHGLTLPLEQAAFEETATFEQIVWDSPVSLDRARSSACTGLAQRENVIFCGPVGVGKTSSPAPSGTVPAAPAPASAGSPSPSSCRRSISPGPILLRAGSAELARADLLLLDDFGLRKLTARQSSDCYDVLVERHRRAATIITSNRTVDEWVALFDDSLPANRALDRFAHYAHQIVMEGPSLRAARAPNPPKGKRRT